MSKNRSSPLEMMSAELQPLTEDEMCRTEGGAATILALAGVAVISSAIIGGYVYYKTHEAKLGTGLGKAVGKAVNKPQAS